jgi:hypothetical protein
MRLLISAHAHPTYIHPNQNKKKIPVDLKGGVRNRLNASKQKKKIPVDLKGGVRNR